MIILGIGALSWYYYSALNRQKRAHQEAVTDSVKRAQGEMALPPLGNVELPRQGASVTPDKPALANPTAERTQDVAALAPDLPLAEPRQVWAVQGGAVPPYSTSDPYRATQRQTPTDRRLSGAAFARDSSLPTLSSAASAGQETEAGTPQAGRTLMNQLSGTRNEDTLMTLLHPAEIVSARAQTLPTQRFLLPKGAFIDCTLETAIDSTLPGMTTCVTATDTFGVDGKVVLLERGSKLIGETRGEVQNGTARVFVLWTEARTPAGVLVPLNSPGTDELGRSGLPGEVNRHFWDRFGAAILISVIDGATQAAVQSTARSGGAIIYNPATSQDALTDVLKGTINIPPTVVKHQGDRIQILVARDLDFRSVYELRAAG